MVARGVDQEGPVPAGYTDALVRLVGWLSVCSFYELTCHALDLAVGGAIPDERAIAWGDLLFERASACRPNWSIDDPWAYLTE